MFSRLCFNGAHCLRYYVTIPAESINHMTKIGLPDKILTLFESRIEINQILDNHIMITTEKVMSKRVSQRCYFISKEIVIINEYT